MTKQATVLGLLIVVLTAGIVWSGCAKKHDAAAPKKIAGIVFQEDQFFRLVLFGMRDAARKNGVELLEANSVGKPDKEIQLVNTYIASGVDAIVVSPLSAKASLSALNRRREKGITVVTYNTTVEGDIPAAFIESDQVDLGAIDRRAERRPISRQHLGGKAQVAILAFLSQAPEQSMARVSGFKERGDEASRREIVAEQDAWLAEQAVKKAGDILTAHPEREHHLGRQRRRHRRRGDGGEERRPGGQGRRVRDRHRRTDAGLPARGRRHPAGDHRPAPVRDRVDGGGAAVKVAEGRAGQKKVSLPGMLLTRAEPEEVRVVQGTAEGTDASKHAPRFEIRTRLRKEYPGTVALDDVSLRFEGGKIHAADRKERRGEEHARQDPRRGGAADCGRAAGGRRAGAASLSAGRPPMRHRRRSPGAEPRPGADGRREHPSGPAPRPEAPAGS